MPRFEPRLRSLALASTLAFAPLATLAALATRAAAQSSTPSPGFTLFSPQTDDQTYLIDLEGVVVHSWPSLFQPGLAAYLADDSTLVRAKGSTSTALPGAGGGVQRIAWDGTLLWDFDYDDPAFLQHHDIEVLPNGNVLLLAWDVMSLQDAFDAGRNPALTAGPSFSPDHVVEVQQTGPNAGDIVWAWYARDHLIQDFDAGKDNFGVVADHPELIDVNFPPTLLLSTDWMHSNSIDYNPELDQILLSVRTFSEIWVIDHSTTTAEAAGHSGGASGRGGDLLYRWGNPQAYGAGDASDQQTFGQHDANWIEAGAPGAGNILVFNNLANGIGAGLNWSAVIELEPPIDGSGNYALAPGAAFGPSLPAWSYTDPIQPLFLSSIQGGATRLANGNTLVCSTTQSWFFEVGANDEVVWEYTNTLPPAGQAFVFKNRRYDRTLWATGDSISVSAGGTQELHLLAGSPFAGRFYIVLGSVSGSSPGFFYDGFHVPLNPDFYFELTLGNPGAAPLAPGVGTLNAVGGADVDFSLPPSSPAVLAGLDVAHAYAIFDFPSGELFHVSKAALVALED